ncbi:MAG: GNAT family N-acetyltransferase [Chthonomonadaceae bacterium]|nr:GNAT family N-acetyltransferase [Chthonomonadaceae bacterium]
MPLDLLPLQTDRDWELAVAFRNANQPTQPLTVAEAREADEVRARHGFSEQFLMVEDGTPVAVGGVVKAFWTAKPSYYLYACPDPGHSDRYSEFLQAVETRAASFADATWTVRGRSDCPWTVDVPPTLGYRITQSNPALRLDLDDVPQHAGLCAIVSVPEFARQRPESWERDVWRLEMDLMHDVPLPEPFQDVPFEQFQARLQSPHVDLEAHFLAMIDGEPIGLTQLYINHADPTIGTTGLTGVLRAHRRKGIARDLKLHAMRWAASAGIRRIFTDTEEANPMGLLNRQLGFVDDHVLVLFAKERHPQGE